MIERPVTTASTSPIIMPSRVIASRPPYPTHPRSRMIRPPRSANPLRRSKNAIPPKVPTRSATGGQASPKYPRRILGSSASFTPSTATNERR